MRNDRAATERLARLAELQTLCTLRDEQTLSLAESALRQSREREDAAERDLDGARAAVTELIAASGFSIDSLRLRQALADAHEAQARQAKQMAEQDEDHARTSRRDWHASRSRQTELQRNVAAANRHLARKHAEQEEAELRSMRAARGKDSMS